MLTQRQISRLINRTKSNTLTAHDEKLLANAGITDKKNILLKYGREAGASAELMIRLEFFEVKKGAKYASEGNLKVSKPVRNMSAKDLIKMMEKPNQWDSEATHIKGQPTFAKKERKDYSERWYLSFKQKVKRIKYNKSTGPDRVMKGIETAYIRQNDFKDFYHDYWEYKNGEISRGVLLDRFKQLGATIKDCFAYIGSP